VSSPTGCSTRWRSRLPLSRLSRAARRNAGNFFLERSPEVGARERYRPYHDRARAQIARELDLIEKLDLAGYFLIVWDIVNYCRQHDILVQGRGKRGQQRRLLQPRHHGRRSGADGSAVRTIFVEERGEWPDIDLDLPSGDRRERVIQHVYGNTDVWGPR